MNDQIMVSLTRGRAAPEIETVLKLINSKITIQKINSETKTHWSEWPSKPVFPHHSVTIRK